MYYLTNLLNINVLFFCKFRYFSVYTISGWIILALVLLIPKIFNNFVTSNQFLRKDDISVIKLDKDIHFLIYYLIVILVALFVLASSTTMVLSYLQHICMMLKITW